MSATPVSTRSELLKRQGLTESAFAVATAVLLLGSSASPALVLAVGAAAVWMAWRGRRMVELAVPLSADERRELDRLAAASRHVRELVGLLAKAGQAPVRLDLVRCRRLARVESMIDGQA
jgi:hypothetical protein